MLVLKKGKQFTFTRGRIFVLSVGACTFVDFFFRLCGFLPSSLFQLEVTSVMTNNLTVW